MSSLPNSTATMRGRTSRLPNFYDRSPSERAAVVSQWAGLNQQEQAVLQGLDGLQPGQANQMSENVVGTYALPLAIAANFVVNGRDVLVPMAIEEPSVVAACSFAAKLARAQGGFVCSTTLPLMIGQIQVLDLPDIDVASQAVLGARDAILAEASRHSPSIVARGGGPRDIEVRPLPNTVAGPMLIVHLLYDTRDAMGANAVNTACEALAPLIADLTGGRVGLRILSNLSDRRLARAECVITPGLLEQNDRQTSANHLGLTVARAIVEANAFALADPYRAATHNKGILNGIDAVALATGNDWRAIEAGAHAYAARHGQYSALTDWHLDVHGNLCGRLELPLAVGCVGGNTQSHPSAQVMLKILNVESADKLAQIMAAVGLAQNLGALRALATEGIQHGHMALHARQLALAAGAVGSVADRVAARLVKERDVRLARAQELVADMSPASP